MRKALIILFLTTWVATLTLGEDLSLQQAINLALRQNGSIQSSRCKLEAAEAQVMAARGSLVPQVTASGSMLRLNSLIGAGVNMVSMPVMDSSHAPTGETVSVPMLGITSDNIGNAYSGKLSASWPIYTGGKIWQGYQISRLARDAVKQEVDTTTANVNLSVKQAYYGLLLARQALEVVREADSIIQKHVGRVQAMYQKGIVSKLDVLRAEVQQSNIQPQIIRMENMVDLARQSLNLLLNRDLDAAVTLTDSMIYIPAQIDSMGLIARALANRPELKQVELGRRIAGKARLISWSGYQPNVVLMADYSTSKGQGFSGGDAWQKNWDVGVAASWILFDGLGTAGRIRQANAGIRQLRVTRDQVENYIRLDVTANYLTLKANEKAILSQKRVVEQAQEAFRMSQARYESGQATNLDVLDAQLALTQAQTNRIQAVHDYLVTLARLEKAVGQPIK